MGEKNTLWDHKVDELVKCNIGINTINEQFVHDNLFNQAFASFVVKYARLVSITRKETLNKIKDNPSNLFVLLNKSGIAWAILIYVNNKM